MSSTFAKEVISQINEFRQNPEYVSKNCELFRLGLSRLNKNDPFLKVIDQFIKDISTMQSLPTLSVNQTLSKSAAEQMINFLDDEDYIMYQSGSSLSGKVSDAYLKEDPVLIACENVDEPINVLIETLLNKNDSSNLGLHVLTDPSYTQIGIEYKQMEGSNFVVMIFAKREVRVLKAARSSKIEDGKEEVPEGDLTELKQAFDLFDYEGNEVIKTEETLQAMKAMNFENTNPVLYEIINELSDKPTVSWAKFSSHVVGRMTNRRDEDGLRTIFDLFIDNPKLGTITFDTFKKICRELGENLSESEMKHILSNTTENGNEINFSDFCQYMKVE
jgi:Ca2+-binding EF-hand superfamily protein